MQDLGSRAGQLHIRDMSGRRVAFALISLKSAKDRRDTLRAIGLPQWLVDGYFEAVDCRAMHAEDIARHMDVAWFRDNYGQRPKPGELGCALSHLAVMQAALDRGADCIAIFEDDIRPVTPHSYELFENIVAQIAHCGSHAAFLVNFGNHRRRRFLKDNILVAGRNGRSLRVDKCRLRELDRFFETSRLFRAHAYLVSAAAARRILDAADPVRMLADDFRQMKIEGLVDRYVYSEPPLFLFDEEIESTIREGGALAPTSNSRPSTKTALRLKDRMRRIWARKAQI